MIEIAPLNKFGVHYETILHLMVMAGQLDFMSNLSFSHFGMMTQGLCISWYRFILAHKQWKFHNSSSKCESINTLEAWNIKYQGHFTTWCYCLGNIFIKITSMLNSVQNAQGSKFQIERKFYTIQIFRPNKRDEKYVSTNNFGYVFLSCINSIKLVSVTCSLMK